MTRERRVRILVTGSRGRISGRLRGAVARGSPLDWSWASREPASSDEILLDPSSLDSWERVLERERPDVIVHLAGVTPSAIAPIEVTRMANVDSVSHLIAAGTSWGVRRIVLASSAAVYGDLAVQPRRESDELAPRGEYAQSKVRAEQLLTAVVRSGGIREAVILRPFNVFGDTMTDSLVTRLLRSQKTDPVTLRGWDDFVRDYVHVDDVAKAFEAAAVRALDEPLLIANVARGIPVSNRALIRELEAAQGSSLHYLVSDGEPSVSVADVSVLSSVLGVTPLRGPASALT